MNNYTMVFNETFLLETNNVIAEFTPQICQDFINASFIKLNNEPLILILLNICLITLILIRPSSSKTVLPILFFTNMLFLILRNYLLNII